MPDVKEPSKSKAKKLGNRQALIDATLDCVADLGLLNTSVSEIIKRAGLSRGMIHLHFDGKANLILAAAEHADQRYYDILTRNLSAAGPLPQHVIEASVKSDLSPESLNTRDISIWYELRGAARTNPDIARFSDTRAPRLHDLIMGPGLQICAAEGIADPKDAAHDITVGLISLLEGLWTDFMLHPDAFDRAAAQRVVFRFLAGVWPEHFDIKGARG